MSAPNTFKRAGPRDRKPRSALCRNQHRHVSVSTVLVTTLAVHHISVRSMRARGQGHSPGVVVGSVRCGVQAAMSREPLKQYELR